MKKMFSLIVFLFSIQAAFSAEELAKDVKNMLKVEVCEPNLFSVLLALIFVICLIYITGIIYTKLNVLGAKTVKKHLKDYDETKIIIHSTTSIGQHRTLHVVEVNGKRMLIGSAPESINLIKELDAPVSKKNIEKKSFKDNNEETKDFDDLIEENIKKDSGFLDNLYKNKEDESVYKKYL